MVATEWRLGMDWKKPPTRCNIGATLYDPAEVIIFD